MKLARRKTPGGTHVGRKSAAAPRDSEGLFILSRSGAVLHTTTPPIVSALRYSVARLLLEDKNGVPARLGVTAALSGEGVSFVARSLAAVLAHDGEQSVCVVDLNWWSGGAERTGGGVADVVRGDAHLDDVLIATDNPRLMLLPAGSVAVDDRAGLARSTALQSVLEDLSIRFHHLVLDLPALLVASEALTLAGYTDACALVVRQGVTPAHAVKSALDHLANIRMLGVVLNMTSSRLPRFITRRLPRP